MSSSPIELTDGGAVSPKVDDLTTELMERSPDEYLAILCQLSSDPSCRQELAAKLNEKPYNTWYSNHAFSVSMLVGSLSVFSEGYRRGGRYFGSEIPDGIPPNLGICILRLIVKCGCDIKATDYYDRNVLEVICNDSLAYYRTGKDEYVLELKEIYGPEICEGIPTKD